MLEHLTVDDFTGTEGQRYVAEPEGGAPLEFELLSAEQSGDPRPFSLLFRGPVEPELTQGIHPIRHPSLEQPLPLFLVPVARADDGMRYEVVFG